MGKTTPENAPFIDVVTILMQPPISKKGQGLNRKSIIDTEFNCELIEMEAFLRKLAYKSTLIKVDNSFFDDSDMNTNYNLIVVYDKISRTPLLSSRYFFDKKVIEKYLMGDNVTQVDLTYKGQKFDLSTFKDNNYIFLADRLSGNINNSIYRTGRANIFSSFYSEIVNDNKNCSLLLMVRKDKRDLQFANYLKLGFEYIGSVIHKGKDHSIILGDLSTYKIK